MTPAPKAKDKTPRDPDAPRPIGKNRQAYFQYEILQKLECGLALRGTEVKSLRQGHVSFVDSYATVQDGELLLVGLNIAEYAMGNRANHITTRTRKLLAHRSQIRKLKLETERGGMTLVPLSMYWKGAHAKVEIGVARGKRQFDKRDTIKKREDAREKDRVVKAYASRSRGE